MDLFPLVTRRFVVGAPEALVAFDYFLDWRTRIAYLSCAAEGGPMPRPSGLDANLRVNYEDSPRMANRAANDLIQRASNWLTAIGVKNSQDLWGYDAGYFARCVDAEILDIELERVVKIKTSSSAANMIPRAKPIHVQSTSGQMKNCEKSCKMSPWLPRDQIEQFAFDFA